MVLTFHPPVRLDDFGSRKPLAEHCARVIADGLAATLAGRARARPRPVPRPLWRRSKAKPRPVKRKLYINTYGCQMNVYDSARMADVLAPLGYAPTDDAGGRGHDSPQHLPYPREGGGEAVLRSGPRCGR